MAPQMIDGVPHIHLQNVGLHPAKKVSELKVGDTIVCNWNITTDVVALEPKGKSIYLTTKSGRADSKAYRNRKNPDTYVAVRS